jgi:hypothetical protein
LGDIARELVASYPKRFASWDEGFGYVAGLSAKYSA